MTLLHRLHGGPDTCALWWVDLDVRVHAEQLGWLDEKERERAERFRFDRDRLRYQAAHIALRQALGEALGRAPRSVRMTNEVNGKPRLETDADCRFNLSHSGPVALIGIAQDTDIGVDVEVLRPMVDAPELSRACFTAGEQAELAGLSREELDLAFLRTWTRKEACLKALGVGLAVAPASFHVGTANMMAQATIRTESGPCAVQVHSLSSGLNFVAAVAMSGRSLAYA